MAELLAALESSVARLAALVQGLPPEELKDQSYASQWSIADVLSHLGAGAVIMRRGIDAAVSGNAVEDGFNQLVWDEWNAKTPDAKASDACSSPTGLLLIA